MNKNLKQVYVNLQNISQENREILFNLLPNTEIARKNYYNIYEHNHRLHNFIDELFVYISENHAKMYKIEEVSLKEYIEIVKNTDFSITTRKKEPKSNFYFC